VVTYQLLPYRVEVVVEPELAPAVEALAPTGPQPVEPRATQRYELVGTGPFEVREEGDHLATVGDHWDAVSLVASRSLARLRDYLSLSGWVTLQAGIARVAGRRALVVGGSRATRVALLHRLRLDGYDVEGDDLVFTRGGEAVCLPTPGSGEGPASGIELDAIDVGVVLRPGADGAAACGPMSTGELVRAVVLSVSPMRESSRDLLRACSALVGGADGLELVADDPGALAEKLVLALQPAGA
jgi:hypothetical protein